MKDMSEEKECETCENCEHKSNSSEEFCGACGAGVESNWKEAGWRKDERIKSLESRLKEANDEIERMRTFVKAPDVGKLLNEANKEIESIEQRLSQAEAENVRLRDALRPFANMSECIESDKDFHIDGDCWIKAKEVLRGM